MQLVDDSLLGEVILVVARHGRVNGLTDVNCQRHRLGTVVGIEAGFDPWLVYQLPANAPTTRTDLLYGVRSDGSPMLDVQKQNVSSKVTFSFRHALACVGDQITIKCSDALKTKLAAKSLYINTVIIHYKNLTNKGKLILNSNETPNWQPVISGEYTSSRMVSLSDATYIAAGSFFLKENAQQKESINIILGKNLP